MVVIFGWGAGGSRDLGEVAPLVCPNCHNQVFMHQVHSEKRVSLYFIPVMPYGSNEDLTCPVCPAGLEIGAQHQASGGTMRVGAREGPEAQGERRQEADGDADLRTGGHAPGAFPGAGGCFRADEGAPPAAPAWRAPARTAVEPAVHPADARRSDPEPRTAPC